MLLQQLERIEEESKLLEAPFQNFSIILGKNLMALIFNKEAKILE